MAELLRKVLEEPCNGTTWECSEAERTASLVMIAMLIAVGVAFEIGKDLLEEHISKASKPVVRNQKAFVLAAASFFLRFLFFRSVRSLESSWLEDSLA